MPKYPGKFGMDKALRGTDEAAALSDRCFTYIVSEFDIAMRSWFSNLRTNPKARPPRYCREPRNLTFEVGRNAKPLGDWTYRLTVLGGTHPDRHVTVKLLVPPRIKMEQVKLIRVNPDLTGTIVYYIEPVAASGNGMAAVDLGIVNLAAVAFDSGTSILYSGRGLLSRIQWYEKRASKCKPSGWNGNGEANSRQSKRLKEYRKKSARISKLAVHNLTRHVINECILRGVGTLVVGDLTGVREGKDHGKRNNQKLHRWPFAEIRRQLEYKAEEVGIEVIAVSEAYTSKTCHFCGMIGSRVKRGKFRCVDCGIEINADVNGAFGILRKVSPVPVYAGVGVGADLPSPPSPVDSARGTGEARLRLTQIDPTFVAKFDLRNWSIVQTRCNGASGATETFRSVYMPVGR
jgi:putative transposase